MRRLLVVASVLAAIAFAIGVAASRGGASAAADTPTPTPTSTPAPVVSLTIVNSGPASASAQVSMYSWGPGSGFVLMANASGCPAPMVTTQSFFSFWQPTGIAGGLVAIYQTISLIEWPSACAGTGASITAGYLYAGVIPSLAHPTGSFTQGFIPTMTPTASPTALLPDIAVLDILDSQALDPCAVPGITVLVGSSQPFPQTTLFVSVASTGNSVVLTIPAQSTAFSAYFNLSYMAGNFANDTYTAIVDYYQQVTEADETNNAMTKTLALQSATCTATPTPTIAPTFTPYPTFPPTPTITPTPLPGNSEFYLQIDCDRTTSGVQSDCTVPLGTTSLDVDVVFTNAHTTWVNGFDLAIADSDRSRLDPLVISGSGAYQDGNPDFDQAFEDGFFNCGTRPPEANVLGNSADALSTIGCGHQAAPDGTIGAGSRTLFTVHYAVPTGATAGDIALSIQGGQVLLVDPGPNPLNCPADFEPNQIPCYPATVHLVTPPTATPTVVIPAVAKQPEGNAANADLSVPKANLWLCAAPSACAGMGEGNLRVVEYASNVKSDYDADGISDAIDPDIAGTGLSNTELGLGAYEFSVEYDNFVIQSVNPCDIVFGPGGAGATRGPVDELNSSAANPDCSPDPNSSADGTCSMSLVLENVIRFGCVTTSNTPYGPFGSFALASLDLIPHPDLTNDIFPGNNNGVITVLKDNGCELADIFGHPVAGSINGGLTQACGDLAVTVRILEGDLNLDCKVDVTDEQLISFRYGAFFGDLSYTKWHDLEPATHDLDIDIKDLQKVFGRDQSSCQAPIPAQPPADPPAPFG